MRSTGKTLEDVGGLVLVGWETAAWLVRDAPKFGLLRGKEAHHGMNPQATTLESRDMVNYRVVYDDDFSRCSST